MQTSYTADEGDAFDDAGVVAVGEERGVGELTYESAHEVAAGDETAVEAGADTGGIRERADDAAEVVIDFGFADGACVEAVCDACTFDTKASDAANVVALSDDGA